MSQSTLDQALATIQAAWRPLDSDLIGACLRALEQLAGATVSEPWLAELHERRPASTELARHPEHGFVLLAHAEPLASTARLTTMAAPGWSTRCSRARWRYAPLSG